MSKGYFQIKPAGRHILTIGRDLIQDPYAAVVELVKNAYDADATEIRICFTQKNSGIEIQITDDGHGMTEDIVKNKWMVPSTSDKLIRRESPKHRVMQGRKGIGRYAVSILGNELLMETYATNENVITKTSLYVDWDQFEKAEFLSDVDILIENNEVKSGKGTKLTIDGNAEFLSEWTKSQFDKLSFELKKLKTPIDENIEDDDIFDIYLSVKNFIGIDDYELKIEPYPLFSLYDYKITGTVNSDGIGRFEYSMQKARNSTVEVINFSYGKNTNCGEVFFDIRAFDRDKDAIEMLISRGLKDDNGNYVGKLQAKKLLDEYNGIAVYRNGFRIRPLGDANFDWLELNKKRVQNPSQKIGSDQVIGIVKIQNEEKSGLVEKSARDGLKENTSYDDLINITNEVISKLEIKRFEYRKKAGISRPVLKIETEFEKLFSFDSLKKNVTESLINGKVDKCVSSNIISAIEDSEKEKNKIISAIKEVVAIYQGQATLGKIINVILHEGRKPLSFFKNQIEILNKYYARYQSGTLDDTNIVFEKLKSFSSNSEVLISLFNKIDPLATGKRTKKKEIDLIEELKMNISVFSTQLDHVVVKIEKDTDSRVKLFCWKQDIYSIFTNLIENSIYWMNEKSSTAKSIIITIYTDENGKVETIDYKDSGPGIEPSLIESGIIFEPEFSTKRKDDVVSGSGLGLSIAGEAAKRCGFSLKALRSDSGAYFRLEREAMN